MKGLDSDLPAAAVYYYTLRLLGVPRHAGGGQAPSSVVRYNYITAMTALSGESFF